MKTIVLTLISVLACSLCGSCQFTMQGPEETKILNYIKEDFSREYSGAGSFVFIKAKTSFTFNLVDFVQDVIQDKYIKGFSFGDTKQTDEIKKIIAHVSDSLDSETNRLNRLCEIKQGIVSKLKRAENTFYLFCTSTCENKLYVSVFTSAGITVVNGRYEFQGTAHTYLFFLDNNEISKVYRGLIAHN